jgi:hypothetical protein
MVSLRKRTRRRYAYIRWQAVACGCLFRDVFRGYQMSTTARSIDDGSPAAGGSATLHQVDTRGPARRRRWALACCLLGSACLALPLPLRAQDVSAGLVLGFGFERLEEGRVIDSSPSALHGVRVGATLLPVQALSLAGHGQALAFDGAQAQYVRVDDARALDVNRFTLAAWVRYLPQLHDTRWEVLEKAGAYWMNIRTDTRRLRAGGFFGGCDPEAAPVWHYLDSVTPIPERKWTHVAATYDGAALSIYINGVLDHQMPLSGITCANAEPLIVGAKVMPSAGISEAYFDGRIDDVRIYRRALSPSAIRRIKRTALY